MDVSEEYLLRTWEVDEGLPVNAVQAITQTPDGYLWLGTGAGLVRFDGARFTTFTTGDGLESNRVLALCVRRSGELWLGLERGGVARFRDGVFQTVMPVAAPDSGTGFVTSLAEDAQGAMWIGFAGEKRVVRWADGVVTTFGPQEGIGSGFETSVHADESGRIWLGAKSGFGFFDGEEFRPLEPEVNGGATLGPARGGGMWVAHDRRLLRCSGEGSIEWIADLAWLGTGLEVKALFEDDDGALWLGTRGAGLYRFHSGQFVRVPTSHDAILVLGRTQDGNLWAGTRAGGLNRLSRRQFFLRTTRHGLGKDPVASLALDDAGALWISSTDAAPVRAVSPRNDAFAAPPGWDRAAPIMTSFPGGAGNVWFGLDGGGLVRWNGAAYERIPGIGLRVEGVLLDRKGSLWVASRGQGLLRWKDGVVHEAFGDREFAGVRALGEDAAGRIWAGTIDGAVFRRESTGPFTRIALPETRPGHGIRFFLPDGPETMWIGTQGGGLVRWRERDPARVTRAAGLPDNDVQQLAFDRFAQAWIGTWRGLCRVTRADLEAVLDRRKLAFQPTAFGRDDGLPNLGFTSGSRHATVGTPDDHLWMATDRGALEIVPQPERAVSAPPRVLIEEMRVAGKRVPLASPTLPSPARQFEIRYTVPRFTAPERLQFRYRLIGFDNQWTVAGGRHTAIFTQLPPGAYRFEVAAREPSGEWSDAVATLSFVIQPAWWETLWFRAGTIVFGAAALAWLVRWIVLRRVRARLRRLEQENALQRERSRIARDLHDQVGAHLTQISLLADAATTPEKRAQLSDSARAAADALGTVVWAVDPRKDSLAGLFYYLVGVTEDFLQQAGISCRIEIPAEVPQRELAPEFRHHVLMVVQEALNNAVKYASATEVELGAELSAETLAISIKDNGRGFEPGELAMNGNGLGNMRERATSLGGECQIESHPGKGTRILLNVPWPAER